MFDSAYCRRLALLLVAACRPSLPSPATPLVASAEDALPPAPEVAPIEMPSLPSPEVFSIEGGPTLWVVPNPHVPAVGIRAVTRRGEDGAHPLGLVRVTAGEMAQALEELFPDADAGGTASVHSAAVSFNVPSSEVSRALDGLAAVLVNGRLDSDEAILRRRAQRVQSYEGAEHSSLLSAWLSTLDHRRGGDARVGWAHRPIVDRLKTFDQSAIQACRSERFAPADTAFLVVGPVEPSEVALLFRERFGEWTERVPRRSAPEISARPPRAAALSRMTSSERVHVLYTHSAPPPEHPDRAAFDVVVELLGGLFSSRLNALREQHAYTYGAHAYVSAAELKDLLVVRSDFEPERVEASLRTLFDELRGFRAAEIPRSRIAVARNRIWANLSYRADGLAYLGMLERSWATETPISTLAERYGALAELTSARLREVVRQHLSPADGLLVLTGDFDRVGGFVVRRNTDGFHLER
ncbi:MAG: insulinase family protein [Myxococcota bacterium]